MNDYEADDQRMRENVKRWDRRTAEALARTAKGRAGSAPWEPKARLKLLDAVMNAPDATGTAKHGDKLKSAITRAYFGAPRCATGTTDIDESWAALRSGLRAMLDTCNVPPNADPVALDTVKAHYLAAYNLAGHLERLEYVIANRKDSERLYYALGCKLGLSYYLTASEPDRWEGVARRKRGTSATKSKADAKARPVVAHYLTALLDMPPEQARRDAMAACKVSQATLYAYFKRVSGFDRRESAANISRPAEAVAGALETAAEIHGRKVSGAMPPGALKHLRNTAAQVRTMAAQAREWAERARCGTDPGPAFEHAHMAAAALVEHVARQGLEKETRLTLAALRRALK